MIHDLDKTLRQLLNAEMPIKNGEIDVSFEMPKREWSARLTKPTINFYLYDLRENNVLRQHQWERLPDGGVANGRDHLAHLKRTPMRADCFYLLTTWANDPEDEHRLLSRCVMTLFRFPVLPAERLVGSLRNPEFDLQARVAVHDRLTNPAEVWSALDNELRPSIPYIVTLALDPWTEVTGPIVNTFTLRSGQASALPHAEGLVEQTQSDLVYIGGTVWDKAQAGAPQAGISVAIKGTGWLSTSDEQGRFTLGGLPAGRYTLVAWPPEGKPREKKINVPPAAAGEYDLEV